MSLNLNPKRHHQHHHHHTHQDPQGGWMLHCLTLSQIIPLYHSLRSGGNPIDEPLPYNPQFIAQFSASYLPLYVLLSFAFSWIHSFHTLQSVFIRPMSNSLVSSSDGVLLFILFPQQFISIRHMIFGNVYLSSPFVTVKLDTSWNAGREDEHLFSFINHPTSKMLQVAPNCQG